MREETFEEQQEDLDPHRREERDGAALELAGRLRQQGVLLTGRETSGQLDDLMTAIDRFEAAVIAYQRMSDSGCAASAKSSPFNIASVSEMTHGSGR